MVTVAEAREKAKELRKLLKGVEALAGKGDKYDRHRQHMADVAREESRKGRDAAPFADVTPEDREEREACRYDFQRFCKHYFPQAFTKPFSPDHLKVIAKIEAAVLQGMLAAFAMPRGYGKTTLSKAAALWAILYGHRRWVVFIGATGPLAVKLLKDGLKPMLRSNERLYRAFRAPIKVFRMIDNSPLQARGIHANDSPCYAVWEKESLVFPRIAHESCFCGESRVTCFGIEGALRGQVATLSTGEEIRPDLVLVDDPQTKASADSDTMTQDRYDIIMGDVLGLAGGDTRIAGLVPCTVIRKDDLAERLLDPKRTPEMRGERTKMMYALPSNDKLWEEYFAMRENDLAAGGDGKCATDLYRSRQLEFDAGAQVAWPEMYPKEFQSCIEYAMFLRNRNPAAFAAEYQNEPVVQDEAEGAFLSTQQIQGKINGYDRGAFPTACTTLTGFVDVGQDVLFWGVAAWEPDFTGYLVDYGSWPNQNRTYFGTRDLKHTIAMRYPGMGTEASITAALKDLTNTMIGRVWKRDDGAVIPLSRVLVDSGWQSETIYSFTRQSQHRAILLPSKGRGITASNVPFSDYKAKPGEKIGENWKVQSLVSNRAIRLAEFDANAWKTFIQLRLATAIGDRGCLSLFKATHYDHRMIAEHLTAEAPIKTEGRGRQLWEWKLPANKPDNHLLDVVVGCAVAASIEGVAMKERTAATRKAPPPNARPSAAELMARRR